MGRRREPARGIELVTEFIHPGLFMNLRVEGKVGG